MPKIPGLNIGGSKGSWLVEQRIDLADLFGQSNLPSSFKERVGQAIIDDMVNRVLKEEKSIHGRGMKAYDEDYINSDEFKAYGKSKNSVNMSLTGAMMNLLDIKEIDGDTVVIGWNEQEQNAKAHGHMTGGNNLPKREFFGANQKALEEIKTQFVEDLPTSRDTQNNSQALTALDILNRAQDSQRTDNNSFGVDFFLGSSDGAN